MIKNVTNSKNFEHFPDYLSIHNEKVTDTKVMADLFNNYFSQVGTKMASTIPDIGNSNYETYLLKNYRTRFKFEPVAEEQIKKIFQSLNSKTSYGYDGISTKLLKQLEPILCAPITLIVNQSLNTGIFPDNLKQAKIIPIFKKEDNHIIENYRPISILPSISKIIERVVHNQIYTYFTQNNIFSDSQYGFRQYHSTEHAVLEVVDRAVSELDMGSSAVAIFLDLSKAFDTLNHDILITKLHYYGIDNLELNWFKSYLNNRKQFVQINHCKSDIISSSVGIPQGSILGPLLFNIYVNDIQNSTNYFKFIMYADDTTLFCPTSASHELINIEFNKVYAWLCANKLSLNIKKTKYMVFHNRNKNITHLLPELKIKDYAVTRVKKFNFLGILIDENLNWNAHIDQTCAKLSRAIGILYRLKFILPHHILKILYNSLVLPHCTYGILSWGATNTDRIFKIQKKSLRIITNSMYNAHTDPLFKILGLLKVHDIYRINLLKLFYQHYHTRLPFYLQQFDFKPRSEIHLYDTRNKLMLCTNKTKTLLAQNSVRNCIPQLINNTSLLIIEKIYTHSLHGFVTYVKNKYISQYTVECTIPNCYICRI